MSYISKEVKIIGTFIASGFAILGAVMSGKIIESGEGGVRTTFGKVADGEPLGEGLNFRVPLIQQIKVFNIKTKKMSGKTTAFSNDTQKVDIDYALNYNLEKSKLAEIYKNIGDEKSVENNILGPAINSNMKNCIAQYDAESLVASREKCALDITKALMGELGKYGIRITAFQIEDLGFEDTFEKSVEAKVVANQEALRTKNETIRIQEEAKQKIIKAEAEASEKIILARAEAESANVLGDALRKNPEVLTKQAIDKWNGETPKVISSGTQTQTMMDLTRLLEQKTKTR